MIRDNMSPLRTAIARIVTEGKHVPLWYWGFSKKVRQKLERKFDIRNGMPPRQKAKGTEDRYGAHVSGALRSDCVRLWFGGAVIK